MSNTKAERIPPHSIEFEKALLGAIMLDGECIRNVRDIIDETTFYRPVHTTIFSAIMELDSRGEPIDMVTVSELLKSKDQLDAVGGTTYLLELVEAMPSTANIEHYARVVHDKYLLRKVINVGLEAARAGFEPTARSEEVFEGLQSKLVDLVQQQRSRKSISVRDLLPQTIEYIENVKSSEGFLTGVGSGFARMDDYTTGFSPGEFVIIAARPSMGKTALAMNMAVSSARKYHTPVGVFSLEMESHQLMMRIMSAEGKIDLRRLRSSVRMREDENMRLVDVSGTLHDLPLYIDDTSGLSISQLRSRARQMFIDHKIGMLIIDYLQLIQPPKMADNQQQWVAYVSASLKSLAKELGIPIICLSQLSRAPETRGGDHRPVLSDLRDSGAIEQDADIVMFVYRPEVYEKAADREKKKHRFGSHEYDMKGFAEIIIAKNRNGPTGSFPLTFVGSYTLFSDFVQESLPMGGGEEADKPF
jgi:replicative DNA helicase